MTEEERKARYKYVEEHDDGSVELDESCFDRYFQDYLKSANNKDYIKNAVNREYNTKASYAKREILEMIQNADDQASDYFAIYLDSEKKEISFINGNKPFKYAGFKAIMLGDLSTKPKDLSSIGNKGLGFRSILNWGNTIDIYSRKVHCIFSREIAKKKWGIIQERFDDADKKDILDNAEKQKIDPEVPISIFAVPDYEPFTDFPTYNGIAPEDIATVVKVRYKEEKENDILEQFKSLSGNTLIFLRNINTITVDINGKKTIYSRSFDSSKYADNDKVKTCILEINQQKEEWTVYHEIGDYPEAKKYTAKEGYLVPEQYEIGFAVKKNDTERYPLYVYFKTDEPVQLPCIVHGTFFLSPNRKEMNDGDVYNTWLQKLMGMRLLDFAEYIAKKQGEQGIIDSWPYNILNFSGNPSERLQGFYDTITKGRAIKKIYPTISTGYQLYRDITYYTKEFADYLKTAPIVCKAGLGNHIIPEFYPFMEGKKEDLKIFENLSKASQLINEEIESVAPAGELPEDRANFIAALIEADIKSRPIQILIDRHKKLLDPSAGKDPVVNTGIELVSPPEILDIKYVSSELIYQLEYKDIQNLVPESSFQRSISKTMNERFTNVTYGDITGVKGKVATALKNCNLEDFKKIVKCLYETKTKNYTFTLKGGDDNSELQLMNWKEDRKDASLLILFDKEYPDGLEKIIPSTIKGSITDNIIWGDINEWKTILGEDDASKIQHFFTELLGVSLYIPQNYIPSVFKTNDYYNYLTTTKKLELKSIRFFQDNGEENENINSAYSASNLFIDTLLQKGVSINNILLALLSNSTLFNSLMKKTWDYTYRNNLLQATTTCSYTAFSLIGTTPKNFYNKVHSIYLDDDTGINLIDELHRQTGREKGDISSILSELGAMTTDLLDLGGWYQRIGQVTDDFSSNNKTTVQEKYRDIRKHIRKYLEKNPGASLTEHAGKLRRDGKLVAVHQGKRKVCDAKNIYYWDNKKLPQRILDNLYKLDIGNRVGEKSVAEIFGVKTIDQIKFTIVQSEGKAPVRNDALKKELDQYLAERWKYVLATICNDDARNQLNSYADKLKTFNNSLVIVKNCTYKQSGSDVENEMDIGDLLIVGNQYNICYTDNNLQRAIESPQFIESLIEALCTGLLLSEDVWYDRFWKILSQSTTMNEYEYAKYDDPLLKDDICKGLGIFECDRNFWETVAKIKGIELDKKLIFCANSVRLQYVQSTFGIKLDDEYTSTLPEIDYMTGEQQHSLMKKLGLQDVAFLQQFNKIPEYYKDHLRSVLESYLDRYNHLLYDKIDAIDNHAERLKSAQNYLIELKKFKNIDCSAIVQKYKGTIVEPATLDSELDALILGNGYNLDEIKLTEPKTYSCLDEYTAILDELRYTYPTLNVEQQGMVLFKGFEAELRAELKAPQAPAADPKEMPTGNSDPKEKPIINVLGDDDWDCTSGTTKKNSRGTKTGAPDDKTPPNEGDSQDSFASDVDKNRAGKAAEQKTVDMLNAEPDKYEIVHIYTKNLNASGDNSVHYDLTYKRLDKNPQQTRYLEVKSMSGSSILMSVGEYDFANKDENKNLYDLAIVQKDKVKILHSPFASGKMVGDPETYKINLKIKKK